MLTLYFHGMPFKKSGLQGPVWTAEGRAKLSPRQHNRIGTVLSMSCELYNTILESWRYQYQWHQRTHQYDDMKPADMYDPGVICGDRGTLYGQFSEYRRIEEHNYASRDTVLWDDLASSDRSWRYQPVRQSQIIVLRPLQSET